jgi:hypothetical protein
MLQYVADQHNIYEIYLATFDLERRIKELTLKTQK